MDIRSQSALLAAIVTLALGISMLLRPKRRAVTLFAVFCLSLFAFFLGEFLATVTPGAFGSRLPVLFGAVVPVCALSFFLEFLGTPARGTKRARAVASIGLLGGLVVGLSPLARVGWATALSGTWNFGSLLVVFGLLLQRMASTESRIERARLRYLAIGAVAVMVAVALDSLPRFGVPFPPLGAVSATLYMFFLAQTILRLRLLDLHELLGKTAALSLEAVILAAIFFVLVFWVGNRLSLFLFNTIVASIVVLILFEPLRLKVEEWVVASLFRERFEMIRMLTALRARLATVIDVREMARLVVDTFHETRRVTHTSLYLLSEDRPGFFLLESRGPQPAGFLDATAARPLLAAVAAGQKAVLLENLERRLAELRLGTPDPRRGRDESKRLTDLKNALKTMHAGITVPLVGGDRVIGFLNLWDERVPEAFASDEIAHILEIAERVATGVENSKLYERMKERDRLAALGEMAAGLAHEIRNPLGAIKGAAQFLSPRNLPQEDAEFLGVIVEEVNRLNTVVSQFLDYSRPLKQNFAPTDLGDVLQRTVKLLSNDLPKNVAVTVEVAEKLPKVEADAEQLKQVLINLLQNAVQAMPDGGTITLSASGRDDTPWRLAEARNVVEVRVRDTGHGIQDEARQHIFVPFYTTKEKGTGLGLAICQRIVKNHGGSISVTSKVGEGTEFLIRLPGIPEPEKEAESAEGTPPPDLTPYPGTIAPPPGAQDARRRKRRQPKSGRY